MSLAVQLAVEESKVTPGLLGFVVVAFLAVATWLLLKSMNTRLKRVDFDESGKPAESREPADTDAAPRTDAARKKEDNGAPVA
ncbi:hypothetical protein B4N89_17855 [Embleya scabrispora]|uniref:Uncharacterized protein n=1 Tax=Embleya scabrispora TaxID=159449 RepID=A0A1T3P0D6_9ACTN|nr:hypothetical protein [Embleya scabrispora]OPC82553.1 hypothetical protein B4N89_17855 [Embleya scabrispora]